jgi:hypothetical protein
MVPASFQESLRLEMTKTNATKKFKEKSLWVVYQRFLCAMSNSKRIETVPMHHAAVFDTDGKKKGS